MASTSVFLAPKGEEFGVVSNARLVSAATSVWKGGFADTFPKELAHGMNPILKCELHIPELMGCCFSFYHPPRPLLQYVQGMG